MGDQYVEGDEEQDDEDNRLDDEDGVRRSLPVLPLFSASYLGTLQLWLQPLLPLVIPSITNANCTTQTPYRSTTLPMRSVSSSKPEPKRV